MAAAARAEVPRGRRAPDVVPTRLVALETELRVGDTTLVLRPGAAVAVGTSRRQQIRVVLAGDVRATGWIDEGVLGARVSAEAEIEDGRVYEGALVRIVDEGKTVSKVESVGSVQTTFEVPTSSLTVDFVEFTYRMPANRHFVTPFERTTLWRKSASVGTNTPPVAVIEGGVEVVLIEQKGDLALVRTYGAVEVQGWALNSQFADKGRDGAKPNLLKPTHEVFASSALYDGAGGDNELATLRGGTLVEVNAEKGARMKVTTVGDVIAAGWVDVAALRAIATGVD